MTSSTNVANRWQYASKDNQWVDFAPKVSAFIESKLQIAIKKKKRGAFTISLAPLASAFKSCLGYQIKMTVNAMNQSQPIVIKTIQAPTNTSIQYYQKYVKNCQRVPQSLDAPLPPTFAAYVCKYKWEFRNYLRNAGEPQWQEYTPRTSKQIELALNHKQSIVILTQDRFREPRNRNVFRIIFYAHSVPIDCEQTNSNIAAGSQTNIAVRYTPVVDSNNNSAEQNESKNDINSDNFENKILNLHYMFKQFYRPLGMQFWIQKKMMMDPMLCSICFMEFKDQNFLEYHVSQMLSKQESVNDTNTNTNTNANANTNTNKTETDAKNDGDGDSDSDDEEEEIILYDSNGQINVDIIAVQLSKCIGSHYFHAGCAVQWLNMKKQCAVCRQQYGYTTGLQPPGIMKTRVNRKAYVGGHESTANGRIEITFEFPPGIQQAHHPNPGTRYEGDFRKAYLPFNREGLEVLELTKIAFTRKLLFSIGMSLTLNIDNRITWSDIHFKTSPFGGIENHGWPDRTYFRRVTDEFRYKGITLDDVVR